MNLKAHRSTVLRSGQEGPQALHLRRPLERVDWWPAKDMSAWNPRMWSYLIQRSLLMELR